MELQSVTHKKAMIEALEKTLGVVSTACKMADISRTTHYRWLEEDPEYKEAVDSIQDVALDFAESKLFKNIEKAKEASVFFYLKTKGKKRGYIERQEIVHEGDIKSTIIEWKPASKEEL
jgi:hypothetical protein